MSLNKNALIRYKTIDRCLQNVYRNWTLNDLIEACSDALYEYENRKVNVSKRSIQLDIQMMRSDKLGYNAPIVVYDRKFYKYDDESYTITNIPITENDMNVLSETVEMLKQFKDFSLFSELGGIIQKLEDKVYTEKTNGAAIIHLDKNENLKGLEHLDVLYQTILKEICLKITYKSFKARTGNEIVFHPYILKEFNNRWFVVGKREEFDRVEVLALDRIEKVDFAADVDYDNKNFDGDDFFKNTIGVTVLTDKELMEVVLKVDRANTPYILTKPLHSSQETIEILDDGGALVKINVHMNFELERLILGFGNGIEVVSPRRLRGRIKSKLKKAFENYEVNNQKKDYRFKSLILSFM